VSRGDITAILKTKLTATPVQLVVALTLAENRLIINPGGVGQPRDSDPRARLCYL